jgi:hypothetical protein
MASAVKVKSGFALAELDLDRRLKDETSYQQKLPKLLTGVRFSSPAPLFSRGYGRPCLQVGPDLARSGTLNWPKIRRFLEAVKAYDVGG